MALCRRLILGLVVAISCISCSRVTSSAGVPSKLAALEGRVLTEKIPGNNSDYKRVDDLIHASFPKTAPMPDAIGETTYHVWRVGAEFLVFAALNSGFHPSNCGVGAYWFSADDGPLDSNRFDVGYRAYVDTCSLNDPLGKLGYTISVSLKDFQRAFRREVFAIYGRRLVLVRYMNADGRLTCNNYEYPNWTCGPKSLVCTKHSLLEILSGSDQVRQLEAFTWLTGLHVPKAGEEQDVLHEPAADSARYWSLVNDAEVVRAAGTLEKSTSKWVSQAAKFFLSIQTDPPQRFGGGIMFAKSGRID